jgi:multicomponent Na+:H+ antiporter subunit E
VRFLVSFIILFIFWFLLSGKTDLFHLALGLISTLIVTAWSGDLLVKDKKTGLAKRLTQLIKFKLYFLWLSYQIILSNIHVLYVALHPNMKKMIDPQLIEFKTKLKGDLPKFLLATSITLTPGTITVRIDGDRFLIHALTPETAAAVPGDMEDRVGAIFK